MGMINLFNSRFQYNEYLLLITDIEDFSQISNAIERTINKERTILLVANNFSLARELHQQFAPSYVMFCIENLEANIKTLEHFAKIKSIEKYLSVSKEDGETALFLIKHRIDEFLFFPIDIDKIARKIIKHQFSEVEKRIANISSLELEDLTLFLSKFYCDEFEEVLVVKQFVDTNFYLFSETKKVTINAICSNFLNNYYNNKQEFSDEVDILLKSFFISEPCSRIDSLKRFAFAMLDEFCIDKAEDILAIIYSEILSRIVYKYKKSIWLMPFINSAKVLCEVDIRFVALMLKHEIQSRTQSASRNLHESVIYLLMNNTSHHLQKHISHISINCSHLKRLRKILTCSHDDTYDVNDKINKLHTIIAKDNFSFPLDNLQSFTKQIVGLFRNFKDEVSDTLTNESVEYLLDFMGDGYSNYAGGLKINIVNKLSKKKNYIVNENIIIAALYSIFENAYEAKATNININLAENDISLLVMISNNGEEISQDIEQYIFKKHFSCKAKKELGHKGLGLSVARSMMENIGSSLYYSSKSKEFILQITQLGKER